MMDILQRDTLVEGGFAGLREHRLVKSPQAFGPHANLDGSWSGIGNFVYLADARFMPKGETRMHEHLEVDVISVMADGRIAHQGSLGHGQDLNTHDVQVQRAGGEGFAHNEINPDDTENRMIQLWFLPETAGQPADYKVYQPKKGENTRIYGGASDADFPAKTLLNVARLQRNEKLTHEGPFLAYLVTGTGSANGNTITEGTLIRDTQLTFEASNDTQLILIHTQ